MSVTNRETHNPYLLLGFFEFAVISTLFIVFFPFSLLFCVVFYGSKNTALLVAALFHDFLKTIFAVFSFTLVIAIVLGSVLLLFS